MKHEKNRPTLLEMELVNNLFIQDYKAAEDNIKKGAWIPLLNDHWLCMKFIHVLSKQQIRQITSREIRAAIDIRSRRYNNCHDLNIVCQE